MDLLKTKIYMLYDLTISYSLKEYNDLIKQCCNIYEMSAVVFLYDNMKYHKINPDDETFKHINKLHSKKCLEKNFILIKDSDVNKLKPRRRIHKIMKGYNYSNNYNNALKYIELVKSYIILHPELRDYNRIKLSKNISKNCNINFDDARYIITNLKRTKFLVGEKDITQKSILDYVNI